MPLLLSIRSEEAAVCTIPEIDAHRVEKRSGPAAACSVGRLQIWCSTLLWLDFPASETCSSTGKFPLPRYCLLVTLPSIASSAARLHWLYLTALSCEVEVMLRESACDQIPWGSWPRVCSFSASVRHLLSKDSHSSVVMFHGSGCPFLLSWYGSGLGFFSC